ncbi:hypothetical protein QZH41_006463 [Actinostola sp. cb2023]|nr:hypothetical protein QZH41_006463 [Actinostola sp. cb2023]
MQVVGRDRMPNLGDRPNLQIIQATIMETLRVGNTSPQTIPHYTLNDTSLSGYRVPKDTIVLIDLEAMHKDPDIWENPGVFYPHRHLDSEGQLTGDKGNLFPFGAGRRVCAGEAFAKVKLFMFLASMLQKFTFFAEEGKPPPSIKGSKGLTLSPLPFKIRAIRRV